jgi:RNA polymerase sigma-B factor
MVSRVSILTSDAEPDLAGADLMEQFREYRRTGDRKIRNALVEAHRSFGFACARRFSGRGEPLDDLVQVAQLGVLKAVERFDPERGSSFRAFASPTVMGELRRHFRDRTWSLGVPRRLKDLHVSLARAVDHLSQTLGHRPTVDELADYLDISTDEVLEALDAGSSYRADSLTPSDPDDEDLFARVLGAPDDDLVDADARITLRKVVASLGPRERTIVYLRFYRALTQQEIADQLGISQVHVSRLLRASLEELKAALTA